ncbi:MAG TPA: hypothetical protein VEL75_20930 [Candidatus Methylomirabilis sp.]|nr:hypothetical protein [Candidatus Methylomirabilis sp.]
MSRLFARRTSRLDAPAVLDARDLLQHVHDAPAIITGPSGQR